MQPALGFERDLDNVLGHIHCAPARLTAHAGLVSGVMGGLDQDVAEIAIAGMGWRWQHPPSTLVRPYVVTNPRS